MRLAAARWLLVALVLALLFSCGDDGGDVAPNGGRSSVAGKGGDGDPSQGAAGAWAPPLVVPPDPQSGEEFLLSQTGLYRDIAERELAPDLVAFEPTFTSWSDGANKQHWLRLPKGKRIDSSDMDHWQFPAGAMLFQDLALHGK
ncbi:MAG TPA: hypothetical protein VK509_20330, partial [Polyangiales bacterium]|nr:hypothetical protein [Polyangiales bacterium]